MKQASVSSRGEPFFYVTAYRIETFAQLLLAPLETASRVLEIGCAAGELATMLAQRGFDVDPIDRTPRDAFPAIAASLEDYETAKTFDCIVAMLVLHHVDDLAPRFAHLREDARIARSSVHPRRLYGPRLFRGGPG
jgi:2-polyprenyl-3-methyl-5-hydroxy-6-metoxy-1,4-benzoquinol methylase